MIRVDVEHVAVQTPAGRRILRLPISAARPARQVSKTPLTDALRAKGVVR